MIYCSKCGMMNSDDSQFCKKCGAQLGSPESTSQSNGSDPKLLIFDVA